MAKKIPEEIRQKVMETHYTGLSNNKIAAQFGISATSVARILKEKTLQKAAKERPSKEPRSPEVQKKIAEIERRIADLEKKILYYELKKKGVEI
jgi:transposase